MKKILSLFITLFSFNCVEAQHVVVTASNNADANVLLVIDANGTALQSIPTNGKGGVAANKTGGGIANKDKLVAVINNGSQNVSIFNRDGTTFKLAQVISSQSKPVSVAFGKDHLYILGELTVESHLLNGNSVTEAADGIAKLLKADGTAAQVGVLLNSLIISEKSNTIELVDLKNGAVTSNIKPVQLPPPPQNDTPVGLATKGDIAYVTIAHSDLVGLVKDGQLKKTVSSEGQKAPCWLAVSGSALYCSNTPSKTISIYKVTDSDIVLDKKIAATVETGGLPSDLDAKNGILAVLDTAENNPAHISQYRIESDGNLRLINSTTVPNTANGIAIVNY